MELVIAGAVILVPLLVVTIVLAVAPVRRAAADGRDESVRAGHSTDATPAEATRHAEGTSAWMRPYGGGGGV